MVGTDGAGMPYSRLPPLKNTVFLEGRHSQTQNSPSHTWQQILSLVRKPSRKKIIVQPGNPCCVYNAVGTSTTKLASLLLIIIVV